MDIIEKLYNICSEQRRTDYPKKDKELKGRKYQILKEKLSPELGDELDELVDEITFLSLLNHLIFLFSEYKQISVRPSTTNIFSLIPNNSASYEYEYVSSPYWYVSKTTRCSAW